MIANLTKKQVASLSPDQQEVIARLAIDAGKKRRSMVAQARGYRGVQLFPWFVVLGIPFFWRTLDDNGILLQVLAFVGFMMIQYHVKSNSPGNLRFWRLKRGQP